MSARIFDLTLKPVVDGTEIIEISENGTGSFKTPLSAVVANYQLLSGKGAVNGYAGLDASQQLLIDNFPAGTALQVLRRNAANTALEFATISVSGGITSINGDTTAAQVIAGTANRISLVDAGATHTFDIDAAYVGQASITTVGTITTGVWNGTAIAYADLNLTNSIVNTDISPSAAIQFSKLESLTSTNIIVGSVANVATGVAMSGDALMSNTGILTIQNNAITTAKILDGNVTYAKIQNVASDDVFLGRISGANGIIEELNGTQATSLLNIFTDTLQGVVPLSGGGTVNFLRADGTWAPPPGGAGGITSINADTTAAQILAGTTNRISINDAGATHTFDIDSAYVGQASITTLGTVTTGVWNGTDVVFANIQDIATSSFLGRTTAATGVIEVLTTAQATALLDSFSGTVKGLVPTGSGNDNTLYLDGTGNWTVPPGGSGGITTLNTLTSAVQTFTQQTDKILINSAGSAHAFTLGTDVVTIDKANTFEDFAQTFPDNQIFIQNPAATFEYQIIASPIADDRTVTLPLLSGNDVFVFESHAQTLANKTLTQPSIGDFTNAGHDHKDALGGGQLVATQALTATGTQDSTTFLRGDNTWDVPPGGSTTFGGLTDVTFTGLATGGIVYKSAGDWINLNPGSNGDVLTLAAGIPSWAAPSGTGITSINGDTTAAQILAGTTNRISLVDAGATHTFDIDAAYVGQSSITTLGTITTGIWNGTPIAYANLNLTNSIVNADIAASAGILLSKLETISANLLIGRGTTPGVPIAIDATAGGLTIDGSNQLLRNALTGDVTAPLGSDTTTIENDAVTYAKMQNVVADNVFLGNNSGANSIVEELSATEATAMLNVFTPSLKGLVPAATGGLSTEYLSADGTFSVPAGGGGGGSSTIVVKSSDQAYQDNSPLINDTELFVVLTPGEYQFEARIWATKTVTSNLNYTFEADGGTAIGEFSNLGTWDSQESIDATPLGTSELVNGITTTMRQWPVYGRIVVIATTTLRFVWAGAGAEPTGTIVYAGSSLTVKSTASGGGGTSPPFADTQAIIEGSADDTKLLRFEVDGFTTATTRVITPPDDDITLAGIDISQTFSGTQTFGAMTATGVVDMGAATSLEIPNSATPTVDADGEIAIDNTVTDFAAGVVKYFSTEEMGVVAMPVAQFTTPADGNVVAYNAATDGFELVAAGAGGGFWEELDRTTLGVAGDSISVSFTAKKYMLVLFNVIDSGQISASIQCNSDTAANYAYRFSTNGAADTTAASTSSVIIGVPAGVYPMSGHVFIENNSATEEKNMRGMSTGGVDGAANVPSRREVFGKWANKLAQISSIQVINSGTGSYAIGSEVVVLGHD